MKWPQIPESLAGLDSKALRALADSINEARKTNLALVKTVEDRAEYNAFKDRERDLRELAVDEAAKEAQEAADAQAETDRLAAEAAETAAAEAAAAEAAAAGTPDPDAPPDPAVPPEDPDGEIADAAAKAARVTTATGLATQETTVATNDQPAAYPWRVGKALMSGAEAASGTVKQFKDSHELGMAIIDRGSSIQEGAAEKFYIASLPTTRPLTFLSEENPLVNLSLFDSPTEIQAAMCPPLEPLYDLACDNVVRRPVQAGLPQFGRRANRGGFKVLPSPSLFDITGGYGQWTSAMDSDPNEIKDACATVTCSSPTDFEWYGIYRCLTVKNMVWMTFPELVNAYLNRLQARAARYAEVLLLEAMANGSDTIEVDRRYGYDASISVVRTVLNYLALYQEIERWDAGEMDAWMPRWFKYGLKMGMASMNRTDGGRNRVPSDAEVDALFTDAGFNPHWYIDRPSWATPIPNLQTAGDLNFLPSSVEILVHKRGKYALMDQGNLQVGVTGDNRYRLSDDLRKNQFTFFYESFEGVIDTDSCPAHLLQLKGLCYSGHQIANQLISCEGGRLDSGGLAS